MSEIQRVSVRRNLEQVAHCVEEGRSVLAAGEPIESALDDLWQAQELLTFCIGRLKAAKLLTSACRAAALGDGP